ncbi:hypothetical protein DRE_01076 [Drechslerella stenobrocha 248]|uniref:6-phosphogluconolactonase n=1 Tax=Drechslerella stenobrocha 248 TaxID=1043628 RepID=W7I667_9PEZI|nr:hypothetical protein DRE_01076 [Drechslerella stenobrocha 248]
MFGFDLLRQLSVRALVLVHPSSAPRWLISEKASPNYLSGSPTPADDTRLLSVGANGGDITIFKYDPSRGLLLRSSVYSEPGFMPSWQSIHPTEKDIIYSTDEGNPGGLVSFRLNRASGTLKKLARSNGINGTVSIAIQNDFLVVAAYSGHSVQAFETNDRGDISTARDTFTYSLARPGPDVVRQEASHPHQALIDPSGKFVVVADLGADLLRLYAIDGDRIRELPAVPVQPGSGPRHGHFLVTNTTAGAKTFFYLVNELRNTVVTYTVNYTCASIELSKIQELDTLPKYETQIAPVIAPNAGEIVISNDKRFVYVSNRNDFTFGNQAYGPSDSIALYRVDSETGLLKFIKLLEAGGLMPRHFSLDETGRFVAIALQNSDVVVVSPRDPETGEFTIKEDDDRGYVPRGPVCIQWL